MADQSNFVSFHSYYSSSELAFCLVLIKNLVAGGVERAVVAGAGLGGQININLLYWLVCRPEDSTVAYCCTVITPGHQVTSILSRYI